ncbi:hypothetical protein ACIBJC_15835 [Streptomyces sp. NPDC050509]|uniref:hypothetical protein n=1 Tax=Streptomyces sp. NPDC050509 TaxID=3365620 RepID=UPI0037AC9CF0
MEVSRWLAGESFPVTRVIGDLEQPMVVDGHPVTFWHLTEESDRKPTYGELGGVLRDLRSLSLPATLTLPAYPVLDRTDRRIDAATDIAEDDRAFLRKRAREQRGSGYVFALVDEAQGHGQGAVLVAGDGAVRCLCCLPAHSTWSGSRLA